MQRSVALSPSQTSIPRAAGLSLTGLRRWALPAILILAAILRLSLLARPGLHPDEALYASWALRIADGSDPALLGVYVDKPPLQLYLLAGLFRLAGTPGGHFDFASLERLARLPGLIASLISIGLLHAVAARLYRRRTALLAAALLALSPLAVRLSPTLFTDPLLVMWTLLALWAALDRRAWLTGLAAGLAYATKQQAVLFLPLILAAPYALRITPYASRHLWRTLNGFALIATLVLWWDSLRWQWMPSYWDRSLTTYGGLTLLPLDGIPERLASWAELLGALFGSPLLTAGLALALPLTGLHAWRNRRSLAARFDLILLLFSAGYLLLHILGSFAPWDRYALPLAPIAALLLARGLTLFWQKRSRVAQIVVALLLALGLSQAAWLSMAGPLPAGNATAYDSLPALSAHLAASPPAGAVLYHHWLGWHYNFYLYNQPFDLRWWATPDDLAGKAAATDAAQLIAFPDCRDPQPVQTALNRAGLQLVPDWQFRHADGSPSLTLYRIEAGP